MKLLLDIGNTQVKFRCLDDESEGAGGSCSREELVSLELPAPVSEVWVSSVAGRDFEEVLTQICKERWGLEPWFARSQHVQLDLKNSYKEPERMGVDRWLAMLAAWHSLRSALCVVDAGSCLTIDFVDEQGSHRGGYILPGLDSMERALLSDTARVRFGNAARDQLEPGRSTENAVYNGLLLSQAGAVETALRKFGYDCPVVFTGGNGELIQRVLGLDGSYQRGLVIDGLNIAGNIEFSGDSCR